ncbi:c-type cytochrome [Lutibaculum baratangense]|nr:cytochrome c [Lutibaculum baratangense]
MPTGNRALAAVAIAAAAGAIGAWALWPEPEPASLLRPGDPQVVAAGAKVYAAQCASCHGADLQGEPDWQTRDPDGLLPAPPHDETGHTWHHPDDLLFRITKHGVAEAANLEGYETRMPAYGGILSDGEIISVLSYIKAQWPAAIRQRHDRMNEQMKSQ